MALFFIRKMLISFLFLDENICCGYITEALLMSTHNIRFLREIRKILCGYPLLSVAMLACNVSGQEGYVSYKCTYTDAWMSGMTWSRLFFFIIWDQLKNTDKIFKINCRIMKLWETVMLYMCWCIHAIILGGLKSIGATLDQRKKPFVLMTWTKCMSTNVSVIAIDRWCIQINILFIHENGPMMVIRRLWVWSQPGPATFFLGDWSWKLIMKF